MGIYEELQARGLIAQVTDEERIRDLVNNGKATFYIGFDPTADSLHVGHFMALCLMKRLQEAGNKPIALIGGGTGYIGDPSGRSDMRSMMTPEQIQHNCDCFKKQMSRFIDFSEGKALMVNNADWLLDLNYIEVLREIGPHFSVNRMLTAECYKQRMEKGLSFLEFNYMIMQAYDFYELFQNYGCNLEFGGDDQWSNMLAGTELIRRKLGKDASAMTITLLLNSEGKKMGIYVLPMPFYINEELFYEDITLTQEEFYEKLAGDADIKTSQPAPGDVMDMWDKALEEYDEVVHIPMSAGLSSSCETAIMLSQDYDGKVQVVNNHRISVTQRRSVEEAKKLADVGKSAAEIKELLEAIQWDSDIYITVDTLKYLKKGGRLTPAAAAIGTVLNLKPVLRLKGEKLDAFAKSRGWKSAKKTMIKTINEIRTSEFGDCDGKKDLYLDAAYTGDRKEAQEWLDELHEAFPEFEIRMDPLSLSVACHIGPGARAVTLTKILHVN